MNRFFSFIFRTETENQFYDRENCIRRELIMFNIIFPLIEITKKNYKFKAKQKNRSNFLYFDPLYFSSFADLRRKMHRTNDIFFSGGKSTSCVTFKTETETLAIQLFFLSSATHRHKHSQVIKHMKVLRMKFKT